MLIQDKGNIYGHTVKLSSNEYTPVDDTSIPTGEIKSVQDTVFDLREETSLTPEQLAKVDGKVQLSFYIWSFIHMQRQIWNAISSLELLCMNQG